MKKEPEIKDLRDENKPLQHEDLEGVVGGMATGPGGLNETDVTQKGQTMDD